MPTSFSACIICKDQAPCIARALDSLAWCQGAGGGGAIVVVDSGSTDATPDLVRNHPLAAKIRFVHEPWRGFNLQRQFAASLCPTDWVLLLDADEECSPELAAEIQALSDSALAGAAIFQMPRKNYIAQRYVRCWSPDYQRRLIHKGRTDWAAQSIPEVRTPRPPFLVKKLASPLLHNRLTPFSPSDFCDGRRMEAYAHDLANALASRGKKASLLQLLARPALTFLKYYLLKGGFLDGRFGLVIAYKTTIGATLKYSVLYARELENDAAKQNPEPPPPGAPHGNAVLRPRQDPR